jgi:hypothetical protein
MLPPAASNPWLLGFGSATVVADLASYSGGSIKNYKISAEQNLSEYSVLTPQTHRKQASFEIVRPSCAAAAPCRALWRVVRRARPYHGFTDRFIPIPQREIFRKNHFSLRILL